MRKMLISSAMSSMVLVALAGSASAGGSAGSLGVGAEFTIGGIGGASLNYDAGMFHAGGFIGYEDNEFRDDEDSEFDLGGRFWYHLHSTAMSDFSVGGQLGLQFIDNEAIDESFTVIEIDVGAQIRAFLASNVALSATLGVGVFAADGDGLVLTGDTVGIAGIHYYFF